MSQIEQLAVLGTLSAAASLVAGLLGAGGGIILMPLLIYVPELLGATPYDAHAASALAAVQAVFAAVGGGLQSDAWSAISRRRLVTLSPALVIASFAGGVFSAVISANLLLLAFAVMTSLGVVVLLLPKDDQAAGGGRGHDVAAALLMSGVGLIGGAVGAGYGPLVVAILLHVSRLPTRLANGMALIFGIFTALPALVGKIATNQLPYPEAALVGGVTVLFVVIGWRLSRTVPPRWLRLSLAAVTAGLAVQVWASLIIGSIPRSG